MLADSSYAPGALGREGEAGQRIEEALRLLRDNNDYPSDKIQISSEVDLTVRALAGHEARTGQVQKAAETYGALLPKIEAANPNPHRYLSAALSLSTIYTALAQVLRRAGNAAEADTWDRLARDLWHFWDAKLPNNTFVRRQLSTSL